MAKLYGSRKLRIITVGRYDYELKPLVEGFLERIRHYTDIELLAVKESKERDPHLRKKEEAERIFKKLGKEDLVVALDEKGAQKDTHQLKDWLVNSFLVNRRLTFVVGSDIGLDESVLKNADLILSLSKLTFSHQIALLVLLEQIYRIFTIISGHPYHRD